MAKRKKKKKKTEKYKARKKVAWGGRAEMGTRGCWVSSYIVALVDQVNVLSTENVSIFK